MLVYILMTEDGDPVMVYSDERVAQALQPQIEAAIGGKKTRIVRRKVDLAAMYAGKEEHHQ